MRKKKILWFVNLLAVEYLLMYHNFVMTWLMILKFILHIHLEPQTPKNYKDFLNQKVHLIEMKNVGVKDLTKCEK